jgi:hypothetical protein
MDDLGLDTEPTYGDLVQLTGRYEVDPIPGGKRFQGAWLVLDDGTRYVIAYRPVPEHFRFLEKRVRVEGRPYRPGADTQHIQATHLEVRTIELAPGETPYTVPPTEPIPPPVLRTASEVAARDGRWARVVGRVEAVEDDPDGYLKLARLRLGDGIEVIVRNVLGAEWSQYVGKTVTVASRVVSIEDGGTVTFELVGWREVCEGEARVAPFR